MLVREMVGDRAVLAPVAGVVGMHRQLVDQDPAVAVLEELDGEDACDAELLGDPQRQLLCFSSPLRAEVRGGRYDLVADAVELGGGHHRVGHGLAARGPGRSEEHTSELQSLMRNSYAVFCLKKKNNNNQ